MLSSSQASLSPEIWGGIECTINRINDEFRDQLDLSGHYNRPHDLDLFAQLGITRLRYPILWERHQADENGNIDWSWATKQLEQLQTLKIEPIAGLLHHGSGPAFTSLEDPDFPGHLAAYAGKVARQFPWINYYTPVNEPLTTARFSGLYGHWFPHRNNEASFLRMLINQVKGIVLSMAEIRKVNPFAQLVQTEDLTKTHSSRSLRYQADFENKRRWLSLDLLCGKVGPTHFFWPNLLKLGVKKEDLQFLLENPCPPDIMGFNYYVTSERYLDRRLYRYPPHLRGGNKWHKYVDTEAVRTSQWMGAKKLLAEAWKRYEIPMAITECHINCSCDEQLRWFHETFEQCRELNEKTKKVVAVTAWALLGSFDWNSLLTKKHNHYEAGVFNLENDRPQWTDLAEMIRCISLTSGFYKPLLEEKGWWHNIKRKQSSKSRKTILI